MIANPQAAASAEFLQRLSAEKDSAADLRRQAAQDRAEAERALVGVRDLDRREITLAEREAALALAQADLQRREAQHRATVDAFVNAVAGVKLPAV